MDSLKDSEVVRIASYSHALGPIMLGNFTMDGALVLKNQYGIHTFYLIQYNDSWTHGCKSSCKYQFNKDAVKHFESCRKMKQLQDIANIIQNVVNNYKMGIKLLFKIIEISNCDYIHHKIPAPHKFDLLLQQTPNISSHMSHDALVQKILKRELQGFLGKLDN